MAILLKKKAYISSVAFFVFAELSQKLVHSTICRRFFYSGRNMVAAPFPDFYNMCPDRIQDHVSAKLQEITVFIDNNGFITSLKTWPVFLYVQLCGIGHLDILF